MTIGYVMLYIESIFEPVIRKNYWFGMHDWFVSILSQINQWIVTYPYNTNEHYSSKDICQNNNSWFSIWLGMGVARSSIC